MKDPPLPLDDAQARLLELAPCLPIELRPIEHCAGFYLAEDLSAQRTQPAAAMSAMDGYALAEGSAGGPWRIVGESAAGHPYDGLLERGEAVRISTGALLPAGSGTILLQEDCARDGDRVRLTGEPPQPGRHIRRAGFDFAAGEPLLAAGTRLGPAQLALAIAAGHGALKVRRALRLTVIDSGDELVRPGRPCPPHRLPASNAPMLAALAGSLPCAISRCGPVPDRLDALVAAFEQAGSADLVAISGGASVGEHDLARPALVALGAELAFWRVAIKPGKPLLVARRGSQLILGLPGNPASAFVTGFLFLLPLIRAALGAREALPRPIPARLAAALPGGGRRTELVRARWDGFSVRAEAEQDSGALRPLAAANALIRRDVGAPAAAAGDELPIYLLENGCFA